MFQTLVADAGRLSRIGLVLLAGLWWIGTSPDLLATRFHHCEYPEVAGIAFSEVSADSAASAAQAACEANDCWSVCSDHSTQNPECEEYYGNISGPFCDPGEEFYYASGPPELWGYGSRGYCECYYEPI